MRTALAALAIAGAALLAAVPLWERLFDSMTFHPQPGITLTPESLGLSRASEQRFASEDGPSLHGFWVPSPGADRAVLMLHGNGGNASLNLPIAASITQMGSHVWIPDYRGYGLSEGRPDEAGVYADARAALRHLQRELGVPSRRTVVWGTSLGGAIAVDLARDRELAGLVLEATFASAADVARNSFGWPAGWLAGRRFDSESKIGRVRCPILMIHGERDALVPFASGRRLYRAAPAPKSFWPIPGAGHNDTVQVGGEAYLARIESFLDRVAPLGAPGTPSAEPAAP